MSDYNCSKIEYLAGEYNHWSRYGGERLEKALNRWAEGFKQPLSQFVFNLNANTYYDANVSYMYLYDPDYATTAGLPVFLERDAQKNITAFTFKGIKYSLSFEVGKTLVSDYTTSELNLDTETSVVPEADSYTAMGLCADNNYGNSTNLVVDNNTNLDDNRVAFLKFDAERLISDASAKYSLELQIKKISSPNVLDLYTSNSNVFDEQTVTHNSQLINIWKLVEGKDIDSSMTKVSYDVSGQVLKAKETGAKYVTFKLELHNPGAGDEVRFYSKEHSDIALAPRITTVP